MTEMGSDTIAPLESDTTPESVVLPDTAPPASETTDYEQYVQTHGSAFLYHEAGVAEPYQITNRRITATRIAVAPDCFLSSITTYATTTAAEPICTRTLVDTVDCTWVTIDLPAKTVGEGEWLFKFRNGSENAIGVAVMGGAAPSPDSHVTVVEGFDRGRTTSKLMQSYVSYEAYDTATLVTPPDPADYTRLTEGKAHIILLAGQSNATGQSLCALLENHVTADQMARYRAGYENILIDYDSDAQARSNGFVPVKLGQSAGIDRFGPEVGLADYLSRVYPEETF